MFESYFHACFVLGYKGSVIKVLFKTDVLRSGVKLRKIIVWLFISGKFHEDNIIAEVRRKKVIH
jgi:hypothetical protein